MISSTLSLFLTSPPPASLSTGDGHFTVEDIRNIKRPITTWTTNRVVEHVLWSDPSDSDSHMKMGVHGSPRGETCVRTYDFIEM